MTFATTTTYDTRPQVAPRVATTQTGVIRRPVRRHSMRRPRHSALFWAAHVGGALGTAALLGALVLAIADMERTARAVAALGVLGLTGAGFLSVLGARRHPRR